MARPAKPVFVDNDTTPSLEHVSANLNELATIDAQLAESTQALARQLSYDGSLNPDALETGIRDSQIRVTTELFHIGARLLLLKEQCAHGEFMQRIERLDMSYRLASRFMQTSLKFSNVPTSAHLQKLGSSKLAEMLILDDEEIKELSEEGSVRGIELDAIDRMSVRELRKQLRDAKAKEEGTQKLIAEKNERLDALQRERVTEADAVLASPDETLTNELTKVARLTSLLRTTLAVELYNVFARIAEHHAQHGGSSQDVLSGFVNAIGGELEELRGAFGLVGSVFDDRALWDTDDALPSPSTHQGEE